MSSNKTNESILCSPYILKCTIIRAENLPIADFTTSDPYVEISIGSRIEGKRKERLTQLSCITLLNDTYIYPD